MVRSVISLVVCCLVLVPCSLFAGNEAEQVAQALQAYWGADYATAHRVLDDIDVAALEGPERVLFFKVLGLTQLAEGDRSSAVASFGKILEQNPSFRFGSGQYSPTVLDAFREAQSAKGKEISATAVSAYERGDYSGAVELFSRALEVDPRNAVARDFKSLAEAKLATQTPTPTPTPKPVEPVELVGPKSCQMGLADQGERVYSDRSYEISSIPQEVQGLPLIQTPNDAKDDTGFALKVRVGLPAHVFVAYDARLDEIPSWLRSFRKTGKTIKMEEVRGRKRRTRKYDVYQRWFAAGLIELGPNAELDVPGRGRSMYFVLIRPTAP